MSAPDFLLAPEEERAAWRALPISTSFIAFLDLQFARVADAVLAAVRLDKATEAKILLGHLDAVQNLRAMLAPDAAADAATPDEAFVDPAELWSPKR